MDKSDTNGVASGQVVRHILTAHEEFTAQVVTGLAFGHVAKHVGVAANLS
jgi:hypothetical protein